MLDVITIGSATRDIFLLSREFSIIKSKSSPTGLIECVPFGGKVEIEQAIYTTGGGGTNAAATFASLGFKTAVITRVGTDSSGRDIIYELERLNIKTSFVKNLAGGATGLGVQLTAKDGERTILVHRGIANNFGASDIPWNKLKARWIYITSLGGNLKLVQKIIRFAKEKNIDVAFNPGSSELSFGFKAFSSLLTNLTIINLNLEEARALTKKHSCSGAELCEYIAKPNLIVIITDGPRGAYAHKNGQTFFVRPSNEKGISRTGAGDAFGSALVAAIMDKRSLEEALQIGVANAESVIKSYGAKIGIINDWPAQIQLKKYKVRVL